MLQNKRILKEIAKRFCKSVLMNSEAMIHFSDELLSQDEIEYLEDCIIEVAERITNKDVAQSTDDLVKEYFNYKEF